MHRRTDCTGLVEKHYAPDASREPANPDAWIKVPLSKLGRFFSGGTPRTSDSRFWGDGLPWVSSKDMKVSRLCDSVDHVTQLAVGNGTRLIQPGTLLMVVRGMSLANRFPVAIAERQLTFNQDLKAFVTNPELYNEFLLYWLEGNQSTILQLATDSTHGTKRISTSDLLKADISLPSPVEQRAIAGMLSDVDELLTTLKALIEKKRAIKQGAMQQLLTGRTRLPGFSREWETKTIGDVAPLQRGFDLPTTQLRSGPYPVVYSNGVLQTHQHMMVKGPGVVTGRSGTIGRVHFIEHDYWPHNTTLWVTSFRENVPKFIYYLFKHISLERFLSGSGVPTLNRNDVHCAPVTLPRPAEQVAISTVLSDMDTEIATLETRIDKMRSIKQGMMQQLLTGRIRLVKPQPAEADA